MHAWELESKFNQSTSNTLTVLGMYNFTTVCMTLLQLCTLYTLLTVCTKILTDSQPIRGSYKVISTPTRKSILLYRVLIFRLQRTRLNEMDNSHLLTTDLSTKCRGKKSVNKVNAFNLIALKVWVTSSLTHPHLARWFVPNLLASLPLCPGCSQAREYSHVSWLVCHYARVVVKYENIAMAMAPSQT